MNTRIKEALSYKRFQETPRILLIWADYFLLRECYITAKKLGWDVRIVRLLNKEVGEPGFLKEIIKQSILFKPDFILTVNGFGLDEKGILLDILSEFKIPCAVWFVDSPHFILENKDFTKNPYLTLFSWDSYYIDLLSSLGYKNNYYLPLATSTDYFYPSNNNTMDSIAFVGDSMVQAINKDKYDILKTELRLLAHELGEQWGRERAILGRNNINCYAQLLKQTSALNCTSQVASIYKAMALMTWVATQVYRTSCISALKDLTPCVYGDEGWKTLLNGNIILRPLVDYYTQLRFVYSSSIINLTITNTQMPHGVNQRVFDIPASGGFILTDYQPDLERLFNLKDEIVTFSDLVDLKEKAIFYKRYSHKTKKFIENERDCIIEQHRYEHRLLKLYSIMSKLYR